VINFSSPGSRTNGVMGREEKMKEAAPAPVGPVMSATLHSAVPVLRTPAVLLALSPMSTIPKLSRWGTTWMSQIGSLVPSPCSRTKPVSAEGSLDCMYTRPPWKPVSAGE
jgi:hypothetical protein